MKLKLFLPLACLCWAGCVTERHTVPAPPPGPTLAEIQSMVQAHVSDDVIVSQIQNSRARYTLTADQIIALKDAGVSAPILNALINSVNQAPVETNEPADYEPYYYPYAYVDPWPWFWWGWWPGYYYGGYYHGYYHGGGYHGGYYHGGPANGGPPHGGSPPHGSPPHGNPSPGGPPHGNPPAGGGTHGGGNSHKN